MVLFFLNFELKRFFLCVILAQTSNLGHFRKNRAKNTSLVTSFKTSLTVLRIFKPSLMQNLDVFILDAWPGKSVYFIFWSL